MQMYAIEALICTFNKSGKNLSSAYLSILVVLHNDLAD